VKPAPFAYHRPDTVAEAAGLLAELGQPGEDVKLLAGGQSLVPMLALRLASFEHLVDISRVAELAGIERRNGSLWIGGGTTEATIEHSPEVARAVPLLAQASPLIGHFQIRNRGTLGGSLAHADAAAEYPAVALALGATIEATSSRGVRHLPIDDFFEGLWTTALAEDEVLSGVRFPVWTGRVGFAIEELARRHGDFAVAGVALALELDDQDRIARCGLALLGLGSTPLRAEATEAAVVGQAAPDLDPDDLGRQVMAELPAIPSDLHGSAAYRARVGATLVARAWRRAVAEAQAGGTDG
jgi:aerobic carbon-monoxide dehydrogenase medium subunit